MNSQIHSTFRDTCLCIATEAGDSPAWFRTPRENWCKSCRDIAEQNLQNYGYTKADQDGYDNEQVAAEAHKEEEMFAALAECLAAEIFD